MEPVLIYTDTNGNDKGAIQTFELDMAFGSDEQDFEATFRGVKLSGGEYLYIDGTEYGGIVDQVRQSTESDAVTYIGRTWHGMLAGKVVKPPSGQDYYTASGDANSAIASLLSYVSLDSALTARNTSAGFNVSYQAERFDNAYDVLLKMLASAGAILVVQRHGGMTELWAEQVSTIVGEADSDLMEFEVTKAHRVPNHLVCAGEGQLQDRIVIDLYADSSGNVSTTQSLFGKDEIALYYNYNGADSMELSAEGAKQLEGYQTQGHADIGEVGRGDWHVGDTLQVRDNSTGTVVTAKIAKKIVKVSNGVLKVDYEVGDNIAAQAASYSSDVGDLAETAPCLPLTGGTLSGALAFSDGSTVTGPYGAQLQLTGANGQIYLKSGTGSNGEQMQLGLSASDSMPYFRKHDGSNWGSWHGLVYTDMAPTIETSNVITANTTNATIASASFAQWGKLAMLFVKFTNKSTITVPANGNLGNIEIGTLASGKRPAIHCAAVSEGDGAGICHYYIADTGSVKLCGMDAQGAQYTIAAGTNFYIYATYILA